jgi:hypothetical protein
MGILQIQYQLTTDMATEAQTHKNENLGYTIRPATGTSGRGGRGQERLEWIVKEGDNESQLSP